MNQQRIDAITGLRGFAALLVVYAHLAEKSWLKPDPHFPGEVGVMIFFSLSGFLIAYLYLARDFSAENVIDYVVARFARIAPAYLFVVVLSFFVYTEINPQFVYAISTSNLFRHIIFSGNVSVFWSIAPEVQFYAIFLLIWASAHRYTSRSGIAGLLLLALLFIVLFSYRDEFPGTFVGSKLHYFLFGVIAGFLRTKVNVDKRDNFSLCLLQLLLISLMLTVEFGGISFPYSYKVDFYTSIPSALLSSLFVFSFSLPSPIGSALFENKLMKLCGDCSFSIYLLNMPIIYFFRQTNPSTLSFVLVTVSTVAVIIAVSWCAYQLIERPGGRMIRAFAKPLTQFWLRPHIATNDIAGLEKSIKDAA